MLICEAFEDIWQLYSVAGPEQCALGSFRSTAMSVPVLEHITTPRSIFASQKNPQYKLLLGVIYFIPFPRELV